MLDRFFSWIEREYPREITNPGKFREICFEDEKFVKELLLIWSNTVQGYHNELAVADGMALSRQQLITHTLKSNFYCLGMDPSGDFFASLEAINKEGRVLNKVERIEATKYMSEGLCIVKALSQKLNNSAYEN